MNRDNLTDYEILNDDKYINASFQLKHLKMIRYRLMQGRKYYNEINNTKLSRKKTIEKLKDMEIYISEQTFDSLFDPRSDRSSIDISAVVAICKELDLDVSQVLAYPEETIVDNKNERKFNRFGDHLKVLDDKNYNGTFYFYCFRSFGTDTSFFQEYPNTLLKTEDLIEGTLSFDIQENGGSIAKLDYIRWISRFDNTTEQKKKNATCIPTLSTVNNNVYLRFIDNDGRVYQIVFDKQSFYSGECYFRIAGMFVESADHGHFPIFQKMLLVRKRLGQEHYDYIRGMLNNNSDTIIISNDMLGKLAQNDPEIQKFMECYGEKIKSYEKPLLVFDENIILDNDSKMSKESKKSVLIKLRHYTFSQNQIYIGQDKYAHAIFKKIQQEISNVC